MGKEEKYMVRLQAGQRERLQATLREGRAAPAALKRARVLLLADASAEGPGWSDARIAGALGVCESTAHNVRRRFALEGLAAAVARKAAEGRQYRKLTPKQEDGLVELAQSHPPTGHPRWTLRLLADRLVALGFVDSISRECVRAALKKRNVTLT
jgi:transposase